MTGLFLYSLFGYTNTLCLSLTTNKYSSFPCCLSYYCHETRIFEIFLTNVWKY